MQINDKLTPMQLGRLNKSLDQLYQFKDGARSLRAQLEREESTVGLVKSTGTAEIDYNRTKFNRMNHAQQRAYMDRLRSETYFYINDRRVPKIVYDNVFSDVEPAKKAA